MEGDQLKLRIERAEKNLQRTIDWVGRHDSRSTGLFGITVAMLGILSAVAPHPSQWTPQMTLAAVASAIGFGYVIAQLFCGQYPKTESPNASLLFFGTISQLKVDEFQRQFVSLKCEDYLLDLCHQAHANSHIVSVKFLHLRKALVGLMVTTAPWATTLYLFKQAAKI